MKMKSVPASIRFCVGDVVEFYSVNSGARYEGKIVNIKTRYFENRGDLITIQTEHYGLRSFYDLETEYRVIQEAPL